MNTTRPLSPSAPAALKIGQSVMIHLSDDTESNGTIDGLTGTLVRWETGGSGGDNALVKIGPTCHWVGLGEVVALAARAVS